MPSNSPTLWITATPLGNIGDLSPRAREILSGADLVLAEDTRRAARLFRECGLEVRALESFFDHNEEKKIPRVIKALREGANIALITDAGSPLMADPGYRLVRACREAGIRVSPAPGPSAPVAALSVAGLAPLPFSFIGFLPRGEKERADLFAAYAPIPGSLAFFERKDRLWDSLKIAGAILGDREVAICRELTKPHEEIIFARLGALEERELLGEITVIIGPATAKPKTDEESVRASLKRRMAEGLTPRQAVAAVRRESSGWSGKDIYKLARNPD